MNNRIGEDVYKNAASAVESLEEKASEISAGLQREATKWLSQLERKVIENPGLALGIAAGAGLMLGMLLKRR